MPEYRSSISVQTALIAEEIERTKQIYVRSLELLRMPVPSTFLGKRLDSLPELDPPAEKEK